MGNTDKGKNFENYVASLYRGLGYSVKTNISLTGQQIDILAEKSTGEAGMLRLAIECKYLESGNVGNQSIFDFTSVVSTLKNTDNITKGILITNAGFSKDAKGIGNKIPMIELLTLRNLEDSLFELTSVYRLYKDKYESDDIFSSYIPSKGLSNGNTVIENLEHNILEWVKEPTMHFLTIFGDYGTGKTTLLERVKYDFVIKYLKEESPIKPIIIYLKDFQKYQTLDSLLYHSILKEFNREISLDMFHVAVQKGSVLLLLDGFDEMVQQVDKEKRRENFLILSKLLPANAIITCRPAYFISPNEYSTYLEEIQTKEAPNDTLIKPEKIVRKSENVDLYRELNQHLYDTIVTRKPLNKIDFHTIDLMEFDQNQIDTYLQKFDNQYISKYNQSWKEIKQLLLSIYDIKDLMTRPILLKMIVATILFEKFDLTKNILSIGPSSLYEFYTRHYLEIEWNKGESRQLLTSTERVKLAMAIAVAMLVEGKLEVQYNEITRVIKWNKSIGQIERKIQDNSIENIASDIKLCTFLTISGDNTFRFVHKSFMEFFVAKFIKDLILSDQTSDIFDILFTKEVLYFLSSFCLLNEDLKAGISHWHERNSEWYFASLSENFKTNISCALISSGINLKRFTFHSRTISYMLIKDRIFHNCKFEKLVFEEVEIRDCKFLGSFFNGVSFKKSWMSQVLISAKEIEIDLFESEFYDCNITCENSKITSFASRIVKCSFAVKEIVIGGNLQFNECELNNSKFVFDIEFSTVGIQFKAARFFNCYISIDVTQSRKINFYNCSFEDSEINGLVFQQIDYEEEQFVNCTGYVLIQEFISSSNTKLQKLAYKNVRDSYIMVGRLLVIYEPVWKEARDKFLDHLECTEKMSNDWVGVFILKHRINDARKNGKN